MRSYYNPERRSPVNTKITPYVLPALIQVSLVLLLGDLLFHVPMRGSSLSKRLD